MVFMGVSKIEKKRKQTMSLKTALLGHINAVTGGKCHASVDKSHTGVLT